MDIAFLIVRLILGLGIAAHGTQKLFGWFGGGGITGTAGFFEQLGFRPGALFVIAASLGELIGGLLTIFGIFGALGPVLIVLVMLVAIFSVHISKGFFVSGGGYELNIFYIAVALAIAFGGNGAWSLDYSFGLHWLTDPTRIWWALLAALVVALLNLLARRPAAKSP